MTFNSSKNDTSSFNSETDSTPLEDENISPLPVQAAEETTESLKQEIAQAKDQWLRAVAELENNRRRAQKEKEETVKYAITHFARDVLSLTDNLRRALESCPDQSSFPDAVKSLVTGVELTESDLLKTLDKHNIKRSTPLHEAFNPNFHQAMVEIETTDHPAGTIVQVFQAGYTLHDRLLRPALVGVSKEPTPSLTETSETKT